MNTSLTDNNLQEARTSFAEKARELLHLPDEILLLVLQQVDYSVIQLSIRPVCRRLLRISHDPKLHGIFHVPEYCSQRRLIEILSTPALSLQLRALHLRSEDNPDELVSSLNDKECIFPQLQVLEVPELVSVISAWRSLFPCLSQLNVTYPVVSDSLSSIKRLVKLYPHITLNCTILLKFVDTDLLNEMSAVAINWGTSKIEFTQSIGLADGLEIYGPLMVPAKHAFAVFKQFDDDLPSDLSANLKSLGTEVKVACNPCNLYKALQSYPNANNVYCFIIKENLFGRQANTNDSFSPLISLLTLDFSFLNDDSFAVFKALQETLTRSTCRVTCLTLVEAAFPSALLEFLPHCLQALNLSKCEFTMKEFEAYRDEKPLSSQLEGLVKPVLNLTSLTVDNDDLEILLYIISLLPKQPRLSFLRARLDETFCDAKSFYHFLQLCDNLETLHLLGNINSLFAKNRPLPPTLKQLSVDVVIEDTSRSSTRVTDIVRPLANLPLLIELHLQFQYLRERFESKKINTKEIAQISREAALTGSSGLQKLRVAAEVSAAGAITPMKHSERERVLKEVASDLGACKIKGDTLYFAPKSMRLSSYMPVSKQSDCALLEPIDFPSNSLMYTSDVPGARQNVSNSARRRHLRRMRAEVASSSHDSNSSGRKGEPSKEHGAAAAS